MISFVSSWEVDNVVVPDQNIFLWITEFVAVAAAVDPNGIKTLLIAFPIKGKPVFCNGAKSLPKNPPDCPILCNSVFDDFILAEELLVKTFWSFETVY